MPDDPGVEVKPMFGNLGAFVNGNMFAGLFGSAVGVRVGAADRAVLESTAGAGPFGPSQRPMKDYVGLPPAWADDRDTAARWVAAAYAHVSAMPTKKTKSTRRSPARDTP
jgi:TfoX/Sxy family transcriptional regulator of competence genes